MIAKYSNYFTFFTKTSVFLLCCELICQKNCTMHSILRPSHNGQNVGGRANFFSSVCPTPVKMSLVCSSL